MMSELQRQIQKKSSGSLLPPKIPGPSRNGGRRRNYSPLEWKDYFDSSDYKEINGCKFHYYFSKSSSAESSTHLKKGPTLILLHGGGYSGLTWGPVVKYLKKIVYFSAIYALDLRGHGETQDDLNLHKDILSKDITDFVESLNVDENDGGGGGIILMGHSMGGALAVHAAKEISNLIGLIVIDVVEGTAMDALHAMQNVLRSRPKKFSSVENAIEWALRSGQVRNNESARLSMPGMIKNMNNNVPATLTLQNSSSADETQRTFKDANRIQEENEDESTDDFTNHLPPPPPPSTSAENGFTWRIDLSKTDQYWSGWFEGLSSKFLSINASKLLLLAGVDRLDKELTVGQMQGKFQLQILPQAGHAVHEDVPERVAEVLASFVVRNKFAEPLGDFQFAFPTC